MSHARKRTVRRYIRGTSKVNGSRFPRDHFRALGVDRFYCLGNPVGARVYQGVINLAGCIATVFRHPTKRRTRGRICWHLTPVPQFEAAQ